MGDDATGAAGAFSKIVGEHDLLTGDAVEHLTRQISLDSGLKCVAISAIRRASLRPMTDIIGTMISVPSLVSRVQSASGE